MSAQEQVQKLQALLTRVNDRRNAPRSTLVSATSVEEAAPPPPAPVALQKHAPVREPSPAPPPVAAAPSAITAPPPAAHAPVTAPPPPHAAPPAPETPAPAVAAAKTSIHPPPPGEGEVDVEVEEGVAEVDIDALEEEEAEAALLSDSVADLDVVSSTEVEDVPASSRRPIQLQTPADEPVSEPPRAPTPHPVPPESGRQVAVPVLDFDGDLSGVRSVPVVATPAPVELKADVTRPAVAAESPAVFRGEVPAFQPKTFGELLDATLDL